MCTVCVRVRVCACVCLCILKTFQTSHRMLIPLAWYILHLYTIWSNCRIHDPSSRTAPPPPPSGGTTLSCDVARWFSFVALRFFQQLDGSSMGSLKTLQKSDSSFYRSSSSSLCRRISFLPPLLFLFLLPPPLLLLSLPPCVPYQLDDSSVTRALSNLQHSYTALRISVATSFT